MASFENAVSVLLGLEGGFHPSDSTAGSVNYGITERFLSSIKYHKKPRDLTVDEAKELYRKYFWDRYNLSLFSDQKLAEAVFASLVNTSPAAVLGALSSACGSLRPLSKCSKLRGDEADRVRERFKQGMLAHYERLAKSRPDLYGRYLAGWKARLSRL